MKNIDRVAYIVLLAGLMLGLLAFVSWQGERVIQLVVIMLLALFYISWGLVYHSLRGDLTAKLFLEYLLIGAIAMVAGVMVVG